MDRRDFLKACTLAGVSFAVPFGMNRKEARAASQFQYTGPLWIMLNANGGWDPTDLCDPKGDANGVNSYKTADIENAGNVRYAPHPGFSDFFNKYKPLIINGIDLSTNGHEDGNRHTWSGKLPDGNPSLASLIAATYAPSQPTSYLSAGGYDATFGIVGATRVGNPTVLQNIAYPNQINFPAKADATQTDGANAKPPEVRTYQTEATRQRIELARAERYLAMVKNQRLGSVRRAVTQLYTAGLDDTSLKHVVDYLPTLSNDGVESQIQIAMAAYRAGATISMSMGYGGFDTHGNHDAVHIPQLTQLLGYIDFLWTEAAAQGVADKVILVVSSEMGRTPRYNSGKGKDHWSITSMMAMGPGQGVPQNKVIGQTDDGFAAKKIDPGTLQVSEAADALSITPAHIHNELRTQAGVLTTLERSFPIYPTPNITGKLFA